MARTAKVNISPNASSRRVTPRKISEPMEMELGAPEEVKLPSTGAVPGRPNVVEAQRDVVNFKKKADALAFMEEKLVIFMHETNDPNADQKVFLGINGRGIWLDRGGTYRIARKYVERLARAKPEGIQTKAARDGEGMHTTHIVKHRAMLYAFSVMEDKNPKGAAWLREIMSQP